MEYWNFLGCYADLSSTQGLEKLEHYLAKKKDRLLLSRLSVTPQRMQSNKSTMSDVFKTPKSRQSSVIFREDVLLRQAESKSVIDYHEESGVSEGRKVTSRKIQLELHHTNTGVEVDNESLWDLTQQDVVENDFTWSSPVAQISEDELNEAVVEELADTLDMLSLQKGEAKTKLVYDTLLGEMPLHKQNTLDENGSIGTGETCNAKDDVDNSESLFCKKKLSYHSPENEGRVFNMKDQNLTDVVSMATDMEIKVTLGNENYENSTLSENVRNENLSSLPSRKDKYSLGASKENCYEDEVFENNVDTVALRSVEKDCTKAFVGERQSFKLPEVKACMLAKDVKSVSHAAGEEYVSIFMQGYVSSLLSKDSKQNLV